GTLTGSGANLTYSPATNFSGSDSFKFTVRDSGDDLAAPVTSAEATVSITVNDTIAPTIAAPANISVNTGAGAVSCGAVISDAELGAPTASDNTGNVNVERSGVPAGNIFPVGMTTITYTAIDAAGNSTQATQTVTVIDNTAPSVTAPAPTSASAGPTGQAAIPDVVSATTASDNCGPVALSQSPVAGTPVGVGAHTITITATDAAGNTNTATTTFMVNDTTAPTLSAPANVTANTGAGATTCGTVVTEAQLGTATASDNAGSVSIARSGVPSGNLFPVGTTTVTYTATDNAGNSTQATQTVTVIDNTAPSITAPAPTSVAAGLNGQAAVPNVLAGTIASDNCGPVMLSQSPVAGTMVGVGTYTITITATDAAGNSSTATTTFTVNAGGLSFTLTAPPSSKRGKPAQLDIHYVNTTGEKLWVSYVVRYAGPCDSGVADSGGPVPVNAGSERDVNVQFHVPKTACTGVYTLTLESYVNGVLIGTTTASLTVTP
ncbi:MAG TPA: HYR domain-containing protein, partial [Pyrinomonadaceae bacterium]